MKSLNLQKNIARVMVVLLLIMSVVSLSACDTDGIVNTWLHESNDGKIYYYTFYDPEEGKLEITHGTTKYMCTYTIDDNILVTSYENGDIYSGSFLGSFEYEITEDDNGKILILSDVDGEKHKLPVTQKPDKNKVLKKYDNYKVDKALLGNWKYEYNTGITLKLSFNADGTAVLNLADVERQDWVYTTESSSIKFARFTDTLIEETNLYKIQDVTLEFMGLIWTKSV